MRRPATYPLIAAIVAVPLPAAAAPIGDADAASLIVAVMVAYLAAAIVAYALLAKPDRPEDAPPSSPRASSRRAPPQA
jgi:hypothetical protein